MPRFGKRPPTPPKPAPPIPKPPPPEPPKAKAKPFSKGDVYRHKTAGTFYLITGLEPLRFTWSSDLAAFDGKTWEYLEQASVTHSGDLPPWEFVVNSGNKWNQ